MIAGRRQRAGHHVPVGGKQYVAMLAGGGTFFDKQFHGDAVDAFVLVNPT